MRIFVTGTGRCGTLTFFKAVEHATNYTASFERPFQLDQPFSYPDSHVAVDAGFNAVVPILRDKYPDARWVWMRRERAACVRSLSRMRGGAVMRGWAWMHPHQPECTAEEAAEMYYWQTMRQLAIILPPDAFILPLEHAKRLWADCWKFMGCEGAFDASLREWDTKYHATDPDEASGD